MARSHSALVDVVWSKGATLIAVSTRCHQIVRVSLITGVERSEEDLTVRKPGTLYATVGLSHGLIGGGEESWTPGW